MENLLNKKIKLDSALGWTIAALVILYGLTLVVIVDRTISSFYDLLLSPGPIAVAPVISVPSAPAGRPGIQKFASVEDFRDYIEESATGYYYGGFDAVMRGMAPEAMGMGVKEALPAPVSAPAAERVSETNVQVPGIDEPDIVKTDGKEIYFSPGRVYPRFWEGVSMDFVPPYSYTAKTDVIKAFPPADLKLETLIDQAGDLLLAKNMLIIFSGQDIFGYDVSNPKAPQKKWDVKLENNNTLVAARLFQNRIYLVTRSGIDESRPCPIKPLTANGVSISIECRDIYHPISPIPVDATFVAAVLDPDSGKIEKNISFVGSSGSSLVYMSENAVYATYSYYGSVLKFFSGFLKEKGVDLVPAALIGKLEKLEGYDIGQQAKMVEFQAIWQKYYNSLGDDERLRISNELTNRLGDYYKKNKRQLERTGIVKVGLGSLEVAAVGDVPGHPLNQFALDEYLGYLRMAITVGGQGGWGFLWGLGSQTESANDVYVLDKDLKVAGSVQDLGLTERIYSARFIEDKGYVVTFRQTDPFYVLDLANPQRPELKGELKIPGYSSYLHPLAKNRILGIGKEGSQVKVSLFDVSSPANPVEKTKYSLDESWSDVLSTHHAFLQDPKHEIFFLPGGKGAYIFSYKGDQISLIRVVSGLSAKRALYLNDYLYVIGENKITILNEADWQKINELTLAAENPQPYPVPVPFRE